MVISFHFQPLSGKEALQMTGPSGAPFLTSSRLPVEWVW